MPLQHHEFTSESVSEGHPDKVSDQISDAIVDLFLSKDPTAKVAVETLTTTNRVVLAGEVRTNNGAEITKDEMNQAARDVVKAIGYEQDGFHWQQMTVENHASPGVRIDPIPFMALGFREDRPLCKENKTAQRPRRRASRG